MIGEDEIKLPVSLVVILLPSWLTATEDPEAKAMFFVDGEGRHERPALARGKEDCLRV